MFILFHLWNFIATVLIIAFLHSRLRYLWDKQVGGALAGFFLMGCAASVFFWIIDALYPLNYFFSPIYSNEILSYIFITGITEESAKFLAFVIVARAFKSIREPQDGVIQGAMVGLAFGMTENWEYFDIYRDNWFMLVRPILCSGGHAVYAGILGGMYSAAVYSNLYSKDSRSYRLVVLGFCISVVTHGVYDGVGPFLLAVIIQLAALFGLCGLFLRLTKSSPYRRFPLTESDRAVASIKRGLYFNRNSSILNRSLGIFLMYQGKYRQAGRHLRKSMHTAFDSRRAGFFNAVCDLSCLPEYHARKSLRTAWGRLDDGQRSAAMRKLRQLLVNDPDLFLRVHSILNNVFNPREWMNPENLADELRRRKAERMIRQAARPSFAERASQLSREEQGKLAERWGLLKFHRTL